MQAADHPELPEGRVRDDLARLLGEGGHDLDALWSRFLDLGSRPRMDLFLDWLREDEVLDEEQFRALHRKTGITFTSFGDTTGGTPQELPVRKGPPVHERFEVLGRLGAGAMGDVRIAVDPNLGRRIALKVMRREVTSPALQGRFLIEAQVTAQLDHPNIVPIYTMEATDDGAPAFAMKLIEGITFQEYIDECRKQESSGKPSPEHTLEARIEHFLKVCDAMAYAHDRGVIHRDLKPENIMLGPFHEVYVMDWGIARVLDRRDEGIEALVELPGDVQGADRTQVGMAIGTPSYMSPEQAQGRNNELGPPSDQFGLGLVLYELVTLRRAYTGETVEQVALRAAYGHREPLKHALGRDIPRELRAIIAKATAYEVAHRYRDVNAFADDLRRFLRKEEVEALPDTPLRALARKAARKPVLSTMLVMGLVLAVVVAASTVAVASLALVVAEQSASAKQERRMTDLMASVSQRGHSIDTDLLKYAGLLDRLGTATLQKIAHAEPSGEALYTLDDLLAGQGPADYAPSGLYGQNLSVTHPVHVLSPGTSWPQVQPMLDRLGTLPDDLQRTLAESGGLPAHELTDAELRQKIAEDGMPILWAYVGLEPGVIINYPGGDQWSDGYDATRRSWYTQAVGTRGPVWLPPYIDAAGMGILLPCSLALYDEAGEVLGVAGISVGLQYLVDRLEIEDLPGLRSAYLLDEEGRVLVRSLDRDLEVETGLHDNRSAELLPFPDAPLLEAVGRAEPAGTVRVGDDLLVFSRLAAIGWTYVVRVDERAFIAGS